MVKHILLMLVSALVVALNVATFTLEVVDNRDYEDDGLEIYILDTHIGYIYPDKSIEIVITGK